MLKKILATTLVATSLAMYSSVSMAKSVFQDADAMTETDCMAWGIFVYKTSRVVLNDQELKQAKPIMNSCPLAKFTVAKTYYNRDNYKKAFKLFSELAEQKYHEGEFHAAIMYLTGSGTSRNVAKGKMYLERAAAQGNEEAIETLNKLSK